MDNTDIDRLCIGYSSHRMSGIGADDMPDSAYYMTSKEHYNHARSVLGWLMESHNVTSKNEHGWRRLKDDKPAGGQAIIAVTLEYRSITDNPAYHIVNFGTYYKELEKFWDLENTYWVPLPKVKKGGNNG